MDTARLDRRTFLELAAAGGAQALLGACAAAGVRAGRKRPPNFLFILADDLGWRDLGCQGSPFYETPHIDRLAAEGMRFTAAYTNAPNCAPTRASLLSGWYTPRHGIYTVNASKRGKAKLRKLIPIENKRTLDAKVVTLAEALKPAGYTCASMGKWHLGDDPELGPLGQGFDVNVAGGHWGHPPAGYFAPYELPGLEDAAKGEYLTDRLTEEAIRFMERNRAKPFFLYLPHYAVHTPLQAKKAMVAKYRAKPPWKGQKNPTYAAMIESLDQGVGRLLEALDRLGLADDTVVFFFSDNGGVLNITDMSPLRGGKGMLYEGGVRVPLIVRWPGRVRPGTTCDVPVMGIDFYPTLLDLAGAPVPGGKVLDGESLAPLLLGRGVFPERALYWHFPAYLEGGRAVKGPWRTTPVGVIRDGRWKLLEYFEDEHLELYDLESDPGETKDLAETLPGKAAELHEKLRAWRKAVHAPVPTEPNPKYDPEAAAAAVRNR